MTRRAFNLVHFLAASLCILSACSSSPEQPATTSSGAATVSPTATPAAAIPSVSPNQPAASQPATASTTSTATKSGWWIRIDSGMTTAQAITLQVGTDKLRREEWRVWRAGDPTEFDVPPNYLQVPRLYVRGSVTPIDKLASFCLMYKSRGVEHMEFNDDESETKRQTDMDFKCR